MPPKKPPKEGHNPEDAGAEPAEHDPEPAAAVMASIKQLLELQQQMMQQQQKAMEQQQQHQQALEQQQQKAHSDQLQLFEKLMAVHLVRGEPASSDKENRSVDHSAGKGAEHQLEQTTLQESGSSMPTEGTQLTAQSVASTTSSVTVSTTPLLGSVGTDTKSQAHSLPAIINLASPGTATITCHGIGMASSLDQGQRHPTNPGPEESTGIPFPPPSLSVPPPAMTNQPGRPRRGDTWPDGLQQAATQPATTQVVSSASADWEAMVGSGNPTPSARNPLMTPALQELYERNQGPSNLQLKPQKDSTSSGGWSPASTPRHPRVGSNNGDHPEARHQGPETAPPDEPWEGPKRNCPVNPDPPWPKMVTFEGTEKEELGQFDYVIEHRAGMQHGKVDGMSHLDIDEPECNCYTVGNDLQGLPCHGCSYCEKCHTQWERFDSEVDYVVPLAARRVGVGQPAQGVGIDGPPTTGYWLNVDTPNDLRQKQMNDPHLGLLHRWQKEGQPPKAEISLRSPAMRHYWLLQSQIVEQDGILFYQGEDPGAQPQLRLLVPQAMQEDLVKAHHNRPTAGHPGAEQMLGLVRQRYHWYGMRKAMEAFVRQCKLCAINKQENQRRWARLLSCHAGLPMERLHLDLLGPFPTSDRGNRYVLAVVDQFTKWAEVYALPNQTVDSTANTILSEIISHFGTPLLIHTDQGKNFESSLFQELCRLLEVTKIRTTPYHASSNGQVERLNRTLLQMIRCYVSQSQDDWDIYLPLVAAAYRRTPHSSTGFSPNMMMLGREVYMPEDLAAAGRAWCAESEAPETYVEKLQLTHDLAREHLKEAQERQKRDHDLHAGSHLYHTGDLVYIKDSTRKKGQSPKLQRLWTGPAVIVRPLGVVLYEVRDKRRTRVLHYERLKACHTTDIPLWIARFRTSLSMGPPIPTGEDQTSLELEPTEAADETDPFQQFPDLGPDSMVDQDTAVPVKRTRSGRAIKRPGRYSPAE